MEKKKPVHWWQRAHSIMQSDGLTSVEEECSDEGAVTEEGAHWRHIIKVAVTEGGVNEGDRLKLHTDKSGGVQWDYDHISLCFQSTHSLMMSICCIILANSAMKFTIKYFENQ